MPSIKSPYKPAVLSDPAVPPLEIHPTDRPVSVQNICLPSYLLQHCLYFFKKDEQPRVIWLSSDTATV